MVGHAAAHHEWEPSPHKPGSPGLSEQKRRRDSGDGERGWFFPGVLLSLGACPWECEPGVFPACLQEPIHRFYFLVIFVQEEGTASFSLPIGVYLV